jgi:hypothetical protein
MVLRSARGLDKTILDRKAFMKFVSLRTKRAHRQAKPNKPSRAPRESFAKPPAAPHEIHTYEELQRQIHEDLRVQHPEWIQPDGRSPMCDSYESRLMELLDSLTRTESTQRITDPHRLLEQGAN